MVVAIAAGGAVAWWTGKRVAMTDMPQMIALYNGMGGGAAAAIAAVELFRGGEHPTSVVTLAVAGALIGTVAFSGSLVAFAKLQGLMKRSVRFPMQQALNLAVLGLALLLGATAIFVHSTPLLVVFFLLALAFGVLMTLPIGGADMPVVISLYNALTGLAVGEERGVEVKFAIHPVAGRMPGHMNVLLAEAGVPYDKIFDLEEINAEFPTAEVALVIGANDVVNHDARNNPDSPIYGMPILDVDKAKNVIVIKRGKGRGFSGIENALFYADNTRMLYGDAQEVATKLIQAVKEL